MRPGGSFVYVRFGGPQGSISVALATVATALGACAICASVMAPVAIGAAGYWLLAGAGVIALLGGLTFLAAAFGRRDRLR
jgi:hypothetical protein